jgi:hypothetical protein
MAGSGDLQPFMIRGSTGDGSATYPELYEAIRDHYQTAITWYLVEKERKGRLSKLLRLFTVALAVVGGAVPLTAAILPWLNASAGYVLLALAGGLQLLDRYFGYSSGWTRYMGSAVELNAQLLMFQVEYAKMSTLLDSECDRWAMLHRYAQRLADILSNETATWSTEFIENSRELERRHASDLRDDT